MKNLKFVLLTSCLFFLAMNFSIAQETTAVHPSNWFTDFTAAKDSAKVHQSEILMVFAGSDWCRPCIQFKKDILLSEAFQEYSGKNLEILYLDFPARKKNKLSDEQTAHNEALAERYNASGAFPNIILMDSEENILANPQFKNQTPAEFIEELPKSVR